MIVNQISIRNILGLEKLDIEPGKTTTISGKNGLGKTSVLKAIETAIGGGTSLSEIKNVNSEGKPEIVLHMEDESGSGYIVKRTAKSASVKKQVGDSAAYEDVKSPQRFLDSLYDGKMSNPLEFLKAPKKDRVNLMLEAITLPFDKEELRERMELSEENFPQVDEKVHPLQALAYIREQIFNERTGVNRDEKMSRSACEKILRTVPAKTPEAEGLDRKEGALAEMVAKRVELTGEAKSAYEAQKKEAHTQFQSAENKERHDLEAMTAKIRREAEEAISKATTAMQGRLESNRKILSENLELIEGMCKQALSLVSELDPTIDSLREDVATLREQEKQTVKIETLKKEAIGFEEDADNLKERARSLTASLDALDDYKAVMCSNLPIDGLEIQGQQIYVDGVPWEQLNQAKQTEIAVKIAVLRSVGQPLRIVWVDGAESLDSESLEAMRKHLEAEDVQAFIGRVTDDVLTVGD